MGLFGRDDKSSKPQPTSAPTTSRPTPSGVPGAAPAGSSRTVIARGSVVDGTLSGSAELVVEGEVRGTIEGGAGLLIAESGRVTAAVHARQITVAGNVKGNVTADERVQLEPSAHVLGDITSPRILIKEGATFDGKVEMKAPKRPDKPQVKQPAAPEGPGEPPQPAKRQGQ